MTQEKYDPHNYELQYYRAIVRLENDTEIIRANKENIIDFLDFCKADGIGFAKRARYVDHLITLAKLSGTKTFISNRIEDIRFIIGNVESSKRAPNTKRDIRVICRKFYKWLRNDSDYPKEVKWLRTRLKESEQKIPEEILTPEEIQVLIDSAVGTRNKALIATLYYSGARAGEILTQNLRSISFEKIGARILLHGKTGMRKVLVIEPVKYLKDWLDEHPEPYNLDAPLWYNDERLHCKWLSWSGLSKMLRKTTKYSRIKKRVHAHGLRHARATELSKYLSESQLKSYFGWTQNSKCASIYIHQSGLDVDGAIIRASSKNNNSQQNGIENLKNLLSDLIKQEVNKCSSDVQNAVIN